MNDDQKYAAFLIIVGIGLLLLLLLVAQTEKGGF